jgi:hypothetical protein
MRKLLLSALLLGTTAVASAQRGPPPVPSPLMLATVPGLSADQQAGVRKILLQHRDAMETLASKEHAEFEAARQRGRAERERADDATDAALRKLLGDDGYRKFAEWHLSRRGPHGPGATPGPGFGPRSGQGPHPGEIHGGGAPAGSGGPAPSAMDDND